MLARIERPVPSAMTSDLRERSQRSISSAAERGDAGCSRVRRAVGGGDIAMQQLETVAQPGGEVHAVVLIGWFILKLIRPSLRQSETRRWAAGREMFRICAISSCVRPAM